jgi:nitrogen fixation protein NifU and related proteins
VIIRRGETDVSTHDIPLPGQVGELFLGHVREPKNLGSIENPSGQGTAIGQCGDSMDVALRIDQGIITDIKVVPHGCIYTLVCASAMSELAKGRELDQALELDPQEVVAALGGLPEDHTHCARLAVNTLGEAISDYYRNVIKSESTERA